ncbi:MAG: hypothetical protein EBT20_14995 [Alphaproteobacteria bacterium]|nr:hypothetical protein [Alphaproteobacteria bacterium]
MIWGRADCLSSASDIQPTDRPLKASISACGKRVNWLDRRSFFCASIAVKPDKLRLERFVLVPPAYGHFQSGHKHGVANALEI